MEKEKLKETVLVNLRSVTQSAKGGVLINRLQEDYKQLIGTPIPVQSIGYSSLERFLSDIPHVVNLRRKGDGQLYVEAVTDASTAHLANLISKQKGATAKSSSASKKYGFRKTAVSKKSTNSSENEKDKIIEDLRNSLEKERKINKDFSSQMIRLNSLIKVGQDTLTLEQEKVKKLNDQLQAFQKNEERIDNSKDTEVYVKAINSLKSKLLEQENKSKILSSRINFLSHMNQTRNKTEKELLLEINKKIGFLQVKQHADLSLSNFLASINATIVRRINTLDQLSVSVESVNEESENPTNTYKTPTDTSKDDNNNTYSNILTLCTEQCEKIQNLENQLEKQNSAVKSLETKFEKRFQKLYDKINAQSQESVGLKYTVAQLTGFFESQVLNNKETEFPNTYCQCSETENVEDNIKDESSEISSVAAESAVSATKRKKKRKKVKEGAESSQIYQPPHRRID